MFIRSLFFLVFFTSLSLITKSQDVWLQNHFSPSSGCSETSAESVAVLINNNSGVIMPSNTIQVYYSIDGGPFVSQPLSSNLTAGASWNFTFSVKANLSSCGNHTVKVWVTRPGDSNHLNDTLQWIVLNNCMNPPGAITGKTTVCQKENSVSYIVPEIINATGYVWTLPSGATGSSNTNSITVNYGTSAISGNITVNGTNTCGNSAISTLSITVNSAPDAYAGSDTVICLGSNITLSATGGNSYSWNNGITQGVAFTPTSNKTYVVTVSNGLCNSLDSVLVSVSAPPLTPTISMVSGNLNSSSSVGNQWYNENGPILGASAQIYSPTSSGNYFVIITDSYGCISDTSNVLFVSATGIVDFSFNDLIRIYPNPISDEFIIEIGENSEKTTYEIINTIGQIILKGDLTKKTIVNTSHFLNGVYLIKIENSKNFEIRKLSKY